VPLIQRGPRGLEPREAVGVGDQANFHGISRIAPSGNVSCVGFYVLRQRRQPPALDPHGSV
jgi:hypothetical protein